MTESGIPYWLTITLLVAALVGALIFGAWVLFWGDERPDDDEGSKP